LGVAGGRRWIGIGTAHFGAGFVGCEHPFDAGSGCISLSLPSGDFRHQAFAIVDAPRSTPISISTIFNQLACLGT
jgi:hypothetical protein